MTTDPQAGPADSAARRPLLIAHRGTPRERPENTLPAFLRALELGADGIEIDVHVTRDGTVVVHHDPVPRATAPSGRLAGRPIDALTFDELQGFSIHGVALIPTLAETLAVVKGRAELFVELKGAGIESAVVEQIRTSAMPSRCAVHSFDQDAIRRLGELAPELRRGLLFDRAPTDISASMRDTGARDVWPHWELINPALVGAVHAAGGRVIAWTVNRPDVARALTAQGVDGLCTDVLGELRSVIEGAA
ncbi:MAG TPA: glycerophosphodiester phosphodiesterase [Gemmatimonadaceae bacterium]|nr:glycerophosphodiester phosphodiesterase [Gemmatimonadaceae bacterium]